MTNITQQEIIDASREEFEAWATGSDFDVTPNNKTNNTYEDYETHCAWLGWQAARNNSVWTSDDINIANCTSDTLEQFCRDNALLAPFFVMLANKLAARSDDRQSEPVATVYYNEKYGIKILPTTKAMQQLKPNDKLYLAAPQQAIPAETKYIWEYKLDGEPENIYETEPMTNEEFRVFNIDKLIHYERGAPIAAPTAPIDNVRESLEATALKFDWVIFGENCDHPKWKVLAYGHEAKIHKAYDNQLWSVIVDGGGTRGLESEEKAKAFAEDEIKEKLIIRAQKADELIRALIPSTQAPKIPLGYWDSERNWHHNPALKMSAEDQRQHNIEMGFL